jgi:hypothetical protein
MISSPCSRISLATDGDVTAYLTPHDPHPLRKMSSPKRFSISVGTAAIAVTF